MEIGQSIQEARKKAKLTQKELAEKVGIATITIQQYERGVRTPKIETLQKISDVLNISWYSLLGENDGWHGLAKASGSVDYNPQKERPMIDADGRLYSQDLKTLDALLDDQFKLEHPEAANYSHVQISATEARRCYLNNLFFCLNKDGQKLLGEMAKAICMMDEYRIEELSISQFLVWEKGIKEGSSMNEDDHLESNTTKNKTEK